jgi:hypothetical protein
MTAAGLLLFTWGPDNLALITKLNTPDGSTVLLGKEAGVTKLANSICVSVKKLFIYEGLAALSIVRSARLYDAKLGLFCKYST